MKQRDKNRGDREEIQNQSKQVTAKHFKQIRFGTSHTCVNCYERDPQ